MVRRIADEIAGDIVELGVDGRLVKLQLEELMGGVDDDRRLVVLDYFNPESEWEVEKAMTALTDMGTEVSVYTQTGFVRTYALGMLGGAVLVAGALLAVTAG